MTRHTHYIILVCLGHQLCNPHQYYRYCVNTGRCLLPIARRGYWSSAQHGYNRVFEAFEAAFPGAYQATFPLPSAADAAASVPESAASVSALMKVSSPAGLGPAPSSHGNVRPPQQHQRQASHQLPGHSSGASLGGSARTGTAHQAPSYWQPFPRGWPSLVADIGKAVARFKTVSWAHPCRHLLIELTLLFRLACRRLRWLHTRLAPTTQLTRL
jgi:hypothetical protein